MDGWEKREKVVTFALASKLLQLRTFKCQKWKAGVLAVRSCILFFLRVQKLDVLALLEGGTLILMDLLQGFLL